MLGESDRDRRVARIRALAVNVFGEEERSLRWLRNPQSRFDQRSPLDLLDTEGGTRIVEEALHQIDDGIFA